MDAEGLLSDFIQRLSGRENEEVCALMVEHLKQQGYWVTEDSAELREMALKDTDLIQPE